MSFWSTVVSAQYELLQNNTDDMEAPDRPMHLLSRPACYPSRRFWLRRRCSRRPGIRRTTWTCLAVLPTLVVVVVLLIATCYPSYSHPPHHYHALRARATNSTTPGRINIHNEKIFIASSIYDRHGKLASGMWGQSVLKLIDLLGPQNVFLSVLEDDPDPLANASLQQFSAEVQCNSSIATGHVDRASLPHIKLPSGETKLKRITFLAHVRNRALAPLDNPNSPAYSVRFDKLLYINDVVFDPVDAANLMFSTNVDKDGKARYHAACAADFINPFKYYDTFATRDHEGRRIGLPVFPWFTSAGKGDSRRDVLNQKDAVRVRSCWGGMAVFDAKWFQPDGLQLQIGVGDLAVDHDSTSVTMASSAATTPMPAPAMSLSSKLNTKTRRTLDDSLLPVQGSRPSYLATDSTIKPIRFRASNDIFWDASECCLVHADVQAANDLKTTAPAEIYMNPYIRVAYNPRTLAFLPLARRFERLYTPFHTLLGSAVGLPTENPRRLQEAGETYKDRIWEYDIERIDTNSPIGEYKNVTRVALPGGFCGSRKLLVFGEGEEMKKWASATIPEDTEWG